MYIYINILLCVCMLAQTSPTVGGSSVGIIRLRTEATEFFCVCMYVCMYLCMKSMDNTAL
jgi:hypothetical protein